MLAAAVHAQGIPNDPLYRSSGSWGQSYPDQWGLQRIGFPPTEPTAWTLESPQAQPVTVAVIDSGLDYTHPDFPRDALWRNPQEKLNGIDDDRNGYIDDVIGWNFVEDTNNPWDRSGHGTLIAGIIAAASDNGVGIAGINRHARIMPLAVLNLAGRGRSSDIAAAIDYAAAHGARVINLSFGGEAASPVEVQAVQRALQAGAVVVLAAGNLGRDTAGFGLANIPGVLVVAATDTEDQRARFSNFGRAVSISAPGVDILGLRARGTDLVRTSGAAAYRERAALVGSDGGYYRASGTSFAAAFVSGVASWILAQRPELTGAQVTRMMVQSARDIGPPGVDPLTGYGLIDARAALAADPEFWTTAQIDHVELTLRDGRPVVRVTGTADANQFAAAHLRLAPVAYPNDWIEPAAALTQPVRAAALAEIDVQSLRGSRRWIAQLVVTHQNGRTRETRHLIDLGPAP
jgi:subtilisin family serine protease